MFLSPTFWLFCTSINLCSNELKCRWDRENENKIQNSAKFPETILLSRMIVIIVCFIDDQVNTLAVLEEIKMRWDWDEISGWRFKAEIWLQFTIGVSQVSSYCALQSKRKKHLVFFIFMFRFTSWRPKWKCFISVSHVNCTSRVIVCPLLHFSSLHSLNTSKWKPDSSHF